MRIEFHPEATAELAAQLDWYDTRRAGLRGDLLDELDAALQTVAEHPTIAPPWPSPLAAGAGVRAYRLGRFPFLLAYLVEGDVMYVVAIAHTRRRPGYWMERLPR